MQDGLPTASQIRMFARTPLVKDPMFSGGFDEGASLAISHHRPWFLESKT